LLVSTKGFASIVSGLLPSQGPANDLKAIACLLSDPERGGFDVNNSSTNPIMNEVLLLNCCYSGITRVLTTSRMRAYGAAVSDVPRGGFVIRHRREGLQRHRPQLIGRN
jgi:hypothetical protein